MYDIRESRYFIQELCNPSSFHPKLPPQDLILDVIFKEVLANERQRPLIFIFSVFFHILASSSSGQGYSNEERRRVELKQNEARISDETNHRIQRRQVIDKQSRDNVRQVRRKREIRDSANSVQLQGSSNPSTRIGLNSGEPRFKKSDHPMDQSSRKLISAKNNAGINSAGEISVLEERGNQDKRDLHKHQAAVSRSPLSTQVNEARSAQQEAKRRSYSGKAVRAMKPESKAIIDSASTSQTALAKEKSEVHDNGRYAALEDDAKAQKSDSENEQLNDEADLDENSAEYEETGEDDDPENNSEVSHPGEESEKLDVAQGAGEEDDFGGQGIVKRETDVSEDEYEDVEDQDGICEDVNLVDESNYQQAKTRPEVRLLEKNERDENRVKRHSTEASENVFEKNEASNQNEEHLEDVRENHDQSAIAASSKSSLQPYSVNSKRQAAPENLTRAEASVQEEPQVKNGNEESNESSNRDAGLRQEAQTDSRDVRLDRETKEHEDVRAEVKGAEKTKSDVEEDDKSLKQLESNINVNAKDEELDSDYEKRVEQQIQQKIDSIKEEIKREVEEKQRIREIEENNAKYDEIQSEIEEDEDEDNQSLDIPSERRTVSKRSIIDGIRTPQIKAKRHVLRRVKRSDTTDARQLRSIEGVERLDPDVLTKAQLRHESIRKRSAPVYGAADKDLPDTQKPFIERYSNPRRVYLVKNEQKRSIIPRKREVRNAIIIPEQAHVNIEDELPQGLSLDPSLLEDSSSQVKNRFKRSPQRFARRRRASAVVPEGRVAFLGYRPQDDDENDEGSEFDDDGFEDRTSSLQQDKSYAVPNDQYRGDESRNENPANFLFAGVDSDPNDYLVRRKRAGIRDDEQPASLRGGGALARRQTRAKAKQMQTVQMTSRSNVMDRDKRQAGNKIDDTRSSVVSLVESSQELSPRLATEYREAFGGLQSDPGGAPARFKRVKRSAFRGSLV